MDRAWRIISRAWPIVFSALLAWAALATIAPEWFQVRSGIVVAVTSLLLHPATILILLALTVIWLAVYLRRLLSPLESRLEALERRPKPGALGEALEPHKTPAYIFAESLREQGRLDELLSQRKTQDASTVATLNQLLVEGGELLSTTRIISTGNAPVTEVECRHARELTSKWEHKVIEWLKKVKPDFEADFMADFSFPTGADLRETMILRVAARLERLRAVKASIT